MQKKKKRKKWIQFRHKVVMKILYMILYPFSCLRYGIRIDKFKEQKDRAYLILYNHQTAFDQFFVGCSFKSPIYYVASEDLFSNGIVSSIIRFLVAPIPIKKQTTDVQAVMNCMRIVKEGGTIAIAPEGNRTYSGKTEYMNPAITTMARKMRIPIVLYRIEGGYGVHPRWSDVVRKGKMHSYVSRVIEPEECAKMTDEELGKIIREELFVNEAVADGQFKSKKKAEYLERVMYVCPYCGLSEFYSKGNEITCKKCNRTMIYGENKELKGKGFDFPFLFVDGWYEYQKHFVNQLDVMQYVEQPMYLDIANVSKVIVYKKKVKVFKNAEILLFGNRIEILGANERLEILFDDVSACSVLGKNKLNIYYKDKIYQIKGSKRMNALKYVNMYFRYKNLSRGEENGEFLGL